VFALGLSNWNVLTNSLSNKLQSIRWPSGSICPDQKPSIIIIVIIIIIIIVVVIIIIIIIIIIILFFFLGNQSYTTVSEKIIILNQFDPKLHGLLSDPF
jgi:hypothetical protein